MKEVKGLILSAKSAQGVKGYLDMVGSNNNNSNKSSESNQTNNELNDKINVLSNQVSMLVNKLNNKDNNNNAPENVDSNNNSITNFLKQQENNDNRNNNRNSNTSDFSKFNFRSIDQFNNNNNNGDKKQSKYLNEEFLDRLRNIEEDVERNYKGPMSFKEIDQTSNDNILDNNPKNNLNEIKNILGN